MTGTIGDNLGVGSNRWELLAWHPGWSPMGLGRSSQSHGVDWALRMSALEL